MLASPSIQTFKTPSFQPDFIYTKDRIAMVIMSNKQWPDTNQSGPQMLVADMPYGIRATSVWMCELIDETVVQNSANITWYSLDFISKYLSIFILLKDSNMLKVLLKSLLLNNSKYFAVSVTEKITISTFLLDITQLRICQLYSNHFTICSVIIRTLRFNKI